MLLEAENRGCSTWRRVLRQSLQLAWTDGAQVLSHTKAHNGSGEGIAVPAWSLHARCLGWERLAPGRCAVRGFHI